MIRNQTDSNLVVENSLTSIKATIHGRKKWGLFLPTFVIFLAQAFCFLPILGLALLGFVQKYFPEIVHGLIMLGAFVLYLYILYKQLLETAEYAFDQEIVEINNQSITVEKSGFLFLKTRKTFLAENVKGLLSSAFVREQFSFLQRIPFGSYSFGAFMILQNRWFRPFYNFGNSVPQNEAESFLESIYRRFPKYRYTGMT